MVTVTVVAFAGDTVTGTDVAVAMAVRGCPLGRRFAASNLVAIDHPPPTTPVNRGGMNTGPLGTADTAAAGVEVTATIAGTAQAEAPMIARREIPARVPVRRSSASRSPIAFMPFAGVRGGSVMRPTRRAS